MNLANLLTCSRGVLAVLFAWFLFSTMPFAKFIALFVFIVASMTDYWDGRVARDMGEVSQFGKLMDPITDKMLTLAAFLSFWKLDLIPFWMVAVVMARDLLVTGKRLLLPSGSSGQAARMSGKLKTVLQIVYIIGVLLYLIAREVPEWQGPWDIDAQWIIRGGMFVIVLMTLFSGLRAMIKSGAKDPAPRPPHAT